MYGNKTFKSRLMNMDFRKISNTSVDCVIFGFDQDGISVLLSERILHMYDDKYPAINDWVITGDLVLKSENLDESADRIMNTLTGVKGFYKHQFRTFGNPERIKNEKDVLWLKSSGIPQRVMSVAYYFLLPKNSVKLLRNNTKWFPVKQLPDLGFDHHEIIHRAFEDVKQKVLLEPVVFEFLEDKFTLNELQLLYESILDIEIDNRNFRRKIIGKTYIIPTNEKRKSGQSKKPANLYMFSKDIYQKTGNANSIISI